MENLPISPYGQHNLLGQKIWSLDQLRLICASSQFMQVFGLWCLTTI